MLRGLLSCLFLLSLGCGDDDGGPADMGGLDAGRSVFCNPPALRFLGPPVATTVGVTRSVRISLERDFCEDLTIAMALADPSVATVAESVSIDAGTSEATVDLTGAAVGTTTLQASYTDRLTGETLEAELDVRVVAETAVACTGAGSGTLAPGGEVRLGGDLASVGIALQEGAASEGRYRVEPFEASVDCTGDILPEGYAALGPAIQVGPAHLRLSREVPITIPAELGLLPAGARRKHVEIAYVGTNVTAPRIVPVANPDFASEPGMVRFFVPRLGTYQAVYREGVPLRRERTFSFRGIMGVSMGSAGSALIGIHNPERFDFVGPLGGPVDWIHMLHYIRTWHLGGFCTEEERQLDPEGCAAGASTERTPPSDRLFEVRQDFEHWFYPDEWGGQGGTFDRREYMQIFQDLSRMFENPNSTRSLDLSEPNITPPGVPDSERMRDRAERCSDPVVIAANAEGGDDDPATGFYDDEYNPEGQYPVLTFCDGPELIVDGSRDVGVWNPEGTPDSPIEVALAVDIDGDGRRGAGEPVIRQGREPFEDCGLDQICNEDEEGYDPVTNPDPVGDDYDFQYNPSGTENNWLRDYVGSPIAGCDSPVAEAGVGELFADVGLDGVAGTPQLGEGGYDSGEGDGCWTMARGMRRMLDNNPRSFVLNEDIDVLRDLDFFGDGGVRDLFNFGANQDQLAGAFVARGFPMALFNGHAGLGYDGRADEAEFGHTDIDWRELGKYVQLRYGSVDATERELDQGDGGHVGTITQAINRTVSVMAWMSQRWPSGDRRPVTDRLCTEITPSCPDINQFTFDFTSSRGRTGPVSVVLPPGYFDEEYEDTTYPVVYMLHGYGMSPDQLLPTGALIWTFMNSRTIPEAQRFQKMIFVFPDGQCRRDECVRGTFYADSPESNPGGAQMETFMLELMDHIDETYRTRDPETHTIVE
jgi:hypothetical protein